MEFVKALLLGSLLVLVVSTAIDAQQAINSSAGAIVPRLVSFSGKALDATDKPVAGIVGASFLIYAEQSGGAPLWIETQNVNTDAQGNYTVQLGVTRAEGLPLDLFTSGEARWLGVRVNGGEEQPRVLLLSVPYALKAADAQTVGGLPASAFLLAGAANAANVQMNAVAPGQSRMSPTTLSDATTGGGTVHTFPLFTTATNVQSSILTQAGSGSTGKIGINTATPATALDVNGAETVRGNLTLPAAGTATASAGKNSQPTTLTASSYNSSTKAAVAQNFRWQAEAAGNNSASPVGTLNLLYSSGTGVPAETGLKISSKGLFTFAPGQTFPTVTGNETVTGDLTASELISTVANGTAPLKITSTTQVANLNASLLGGKAASAFAQVAAANTFSGNLTVGVSATDAVDAYTSGPGKSALVGVQRATSGGSYGVYAETFDPTGAGVAGINNGTSQAQGIGVYGESGTFGLGVFGQSGTSKSTAGQQFIGPAGIWGDGGNDGGAGVLGSADDNNAAVFQNNSSTGYATVIIQAFNAGTPPLIAYGTAGNCSVDGQGDLSCTGTKNAVVPIDGGARRVAMSAIESPVNWFEDFGAGQLINGVAVVRLDPTFIQTVNTEMDYKVFPVPNGDCKGLYVTNKKATSFEVRELGGGTSNVAFDYRITALRRNYEKVRFADHTYDLKPVKPMRGAKPASHGAAKNLTTLPARGASPIPPPAR
jgi:hypothetical protein